MPVYTQEKDPDETVDYTIDWSDELASGETISTSTWTVPSGITKASDSKTDTTTTAVFSGGTAGEEYMCINTILTTGGSVARTMTKTIIIPVLQD